MNKSHLTAKAGTRARSSVAAAPVRQSLLELDDEELVDVRDDDPWMPTAILDEEESDWTDDEEEQRAAGPGFRRQARDFLAPDESELNLLLHGVSYR